MRGADGYQRRSLGRPQRARLLVVCGADQTEPTYVRALLHEHKLPGSHVLPVKHGRDPMRVVAEAARMAAGEEWDEVWCVFDHDQFANAEAACGRAVEQGFQVACSNPCFEVWFLLHYRYKAAQIRDGAAAVRELTRLRGKPYSKGDDLYPGLRERQDDALDRAQCLRDEHVSRGRLESHNPSTSVDLLVRRVRRDLPAP
jgi:hypothetical protein